LRPLTVIFLAPVLLAAPVRATDPSPLGTETPGGNSFSAVQLLPAGSVLKKVMIPRYDSRRHLTTIMRAVEMTVIDKESVEAKTVTMVFYGADGAPESQVNMKFAHYDQAKGKLESDDPVEILSQSFKAEGSGVRYVYTDDTKPGPDGKVPPPTMPPSDPKQMQGFLFGPVTTRFYAKPSTP